MAAISGEAAGHVTTCRTKERAGEQPPRAPARARKAPPQSTRANPLESEAASGRHARQSPGQMRPRGPCARARARAQVSARQAARAGTRAPVLRVLDCNAASAPRHEDEHIARVASLCSMTAGGSFAGTVHTRCGAAGCLRHASFCSGPPLLPARKLPLSCLSSLLLLEGGRPKKTQFFCCGKI